MTYPINTALDYFALTYGDAVTYWTRNDKPYLMPAPERAEWHRDAHEREQIELWNLIEEQTELAHLIAEAATAAALR